MAMMTTGKHPPDTSDGPGRPAGRLPGRAGWLASFGLAILSGLVLGVAFAAPPSFDTLLEEADRLRTADSRQFDRLLSRLDALAADATPEQQARLRLMHAYGYIRSGDLQTSIRELEALRGRVEDVELRFRIGALLANNYALTRQFSEGITALNETMPLIGQVRDRDVRHQGLLAAAILYNQVGQYELGRHYAEQVLAQDASGRSTCFAGNLRLEALEERATEASIVSVIERCELEGEGIATGIARTYLARKWFSDGDVNRAIDLLDAHVADVEATGYARLIGQVQALLAKYRLENGDAARARRHALAAIEASRGSPHLVPVVIAYETLYKIADAAGDPDLALDYYRRYAEADKAYLNDVKARELAYQVVRQETEQKSQQIELLDRQNQVLKLRQEVSEQSAQNTRLLVALLSVLLASIGYWAWRVTRRHQSLRRLAEVDSLTGVCNRRHFMLQAEQCLAQCGRRDEVVALVMFDLDHFKRINDGFGHVTGDWVLEQVADACRALCRRVDHIGRLGGEEFAILLPGCDAAAAGRLAEQCRARIAAIDTSGSGHAFPLAASFGVTDTRLSGYVLGRVLSHADQALYMAKHGGRNLVCVYDGEGGRQVPRAPAATEPAGSEPVAGPA